jgi:hypothetical protein
MMPMLAFHLLVRGIQHARPSPAARCGQRLLKRPIFAALAAGRAAGNALGAVQDWLYNEVRSLRVCG